MKIKSLIHLTLTLFLLFGGMGCREADQGPTEAVFAGYRDPAPGPRFFYPASIICQTWESLVGTRKNCYEPRPVLAESWTMAEDGKRWVFRLRKGVVFQDGTPFDADAVLANFTRLQKAPGKTRFYRFRMDRFYPGFSSIQKLDTHTIALNFKFPVPTLPYYMANWGSPMFSPACFDPDTGAFTRKPAGTGPFRITDHRPEQYVILERFDRYWGEKAKIPRIRIRVIPDVHTRFSALRAGEILSTVDLRGMTPSLAAELIKDSRFGISTEKSSIVHFLALNQEKFPFNDPRMKEAVHLMIDRHLISKEFFHGYYPPAANLLSHASPFYKPVPSVHDPERARMLARQVLGEKRADVDLILPANLSSDPYGDIAQYLQSVLADLGLVLHIRRIEGGGFNDIVLAGDFNMYLRCQGLPHGDAMGIFEDYMRLQSPCGMDNETQNRRFHYNYSSFEAEALLDQAGQTLDLAKRRELYHKLQDIAARTLPILPLVHETNLLVFNKSLEGYEAMVYGSTLAAAQRKPGH